MNYMKNLTVDKCVKVMLYGYVGFTFFFLFINAFM